MTVERKVFSSDVHDFNASLSEHDFEKVRGESARPGEDCQ